MTAAVSDPMAVFADPSWRAELGMLAESTRIAARGYAADAFLLVSLASQVPEPTGTRDGALPWQSFVREVALARGVQERAAAHQVALATVLVRSAPRTLELLACGAVTVNRATALLEELQGTDAGVAHTVDRALWQRIATMTPERIRRAARREIDRLDADAAAERASRAGAGRGVRFGSQRDGQASAFVTGPAVPLARWHAALTEAARAQQAAGDPRSLDALRFDLLVAGFTCDDLSPRPAQAPSEQPPAVPPRTADPAPVPDALLSPAERGPAERAPVERAEHAGTPPSSPGHQPDAGPAPLPPCGPGHEPAPHSAEADDGPATTSPAFDAASVGAPPEVLPSADDCPGDPLPVDDFASARAQAAALLHRARAQAERVLEAAHAAEAEALDRVRAARAEADRLTAQAVRDRLTASALTPQDRRQVRPVQLLVHVPVTTLLGLADEPGWLDGYGWIGAPQCRQLLPTAELRQVCTTSSGQVMDLAPRAVRPTATPEGARQALLDMATRPFDITEAAWRTSERHDPPASVSDLVRTRDRYCDGPLGTLVPAARSDLDHGQPWPEGPTAAWNLAARARRTHRFKHRGWIPVRTGGSTLWTTPAGQLVEAPHHQEPPEPLAVDARLPDPVALHAFESELVRPR